MFKKILSGLLIVLGAISFIGCGTNSTVKEEQINYWDIAEEYNSAKQYSSGDIVMYEGEVGKLYWNNGYTSRFYVGDMRIGWEDGIYYSMKKVAQELEFGGKIRIVGKNVGGIFSALDCVILEKYPVTLDSYITERAKMDTDGISESEARKLYKWCEEDQYCKQFEEALENNIYNLYPDIIVF